MPTGYTSDIYNGNDVSLKDFAAQCAHGMMVFVHQRDSNDDKLYYRQPSKYHLEKQRQAKITLDLLDSLDEEELYGMWSAYYRYAEAKMYRLIAEKSEIQARYDRMIAEVKAVSVPDELESFKEFMLSQLDDSVRFDVLSKERIVEYNSPLSYEEWTDTNHREAERDLQYHAKEYQKELDRCAEQRRYADLMVEAFGIEVLEPDDEV